MAKSIYPELTNEQAHALQSYAEENGRRWKGKLNDDWMLGRVYGALQQVRNEFGPTWLKSYRLPD